MERFTRKSVKYRGGVDSGNIYSNPRKDADRHGYEASA